MSSPELERWRERLEQAERDLTEMNVQVETGEIDPQTAARLQARYAEEADDARERVAELEQEHHDAGAAQTAGPSRSRMAWGAGLLAVSAVVVLVTFNAFAQAPVDDTLQGVAAGETFDPSEYSDETMEAVIASYADDPAVASQLPYMRFALAERYFDRGDYQKAFGHYEEILASDPAADLFSPSMTRLAWIVWVGNGETELALGLLDRALEATPGWPEALYVKGQLLWCGSEDPARAVELFDQVLSSDTLDDSIRQQVETDRNIAAAGGSCR